MLIGKPIVNCSIVAENIFAVVFEAFFTALAEKLGAAVNLVLFLVIIVALISFVVYLSAFSVFFDRNRQILPVRLERDTVDFNGKPVADGFLVVTNWCNLVLL